MKKWIVLITLIAGLGSVLQAQERNRREIDPEKAAERMTERMTKELDLTPEQAQAVKPINLEFVTKAKEIKNSEAGKEDKKAQLETLRKENETKMAQVLTPEQMEKYREMIEKQKEKVREHRRKH